MKTKNKKAFFHVLLYGSLWGMAEAILGYVLHLLPFGVSGIIMFPIGYYFMIKAYRKTQNAGCVFLAGMVAAAVKLVDLLLNVLPVIRVLHPALAILLEALFTAAALKLFSSGTAQPNLKSVVLASVGWRVCFILYQYAMTFASIPSGIIDGGLSSVAGFVLYEGLLNSAIVYLALKYPIRIKLFKVPVKIQESPYAASALFVIALAVNLVL